MRAIRSTYHYNEWVWRPSPLGNHSVNNTVPNIGRTSILAWWWFSEDYASYINIYRLKLRRHTLKWKINWEKESFYIFISTKILPITILFVIILKANINYLDLLLLLLVLKALKLWHPLGRIILRKDFLVLASLSHIN